MKNIYVGEILENVNNAGESLSGFKFPIGFAFIPRGKSRTVYTVKDLYLTRNSSGDIVCKRYFCVHDLLGIAVTSEEVETTLLMSEPCARDLT